MNSTARGYLYGRDRRLDEILELARHGVARLAARPQHDERLDDRAALGIVRTHDGALEHGLVHDQRLLDLGPGDVVAAGHDHVVGARLVVEVAVLVDDIGVAGDVPAVADVVELPGVVEVATAGRATHGEPPDDARAYIVHVVVDDARLVPRHRPPGRAGADVVVRGTDEDVNHLRRADAVDDRDARGLVPGLPHGPRQRLARRDAAAQARDPAIDAERQHAAIGGRCREAGRGAVALDRVEQLVGSALLEQDGGRADPHRERHDAAEAERERDRGRADEDVVAARAHDLARERVAHREYVAVEVHRALRPAGRAAGVGDQHHVVGCRVVGLEALGLARGPLLDLREPHEPVAGSLELVEQPVVAQRDADRGVGDDLLQLLAAQQRHRRHHDAARLGDGEPAGHHHRACSARAGARDCR